MKLIKVGGAVLNQTPIAWEHNKQNILNAIREAKERSIRILCLPELCISGYGCEDAFYSPGLLQTSYDILKEIVPFTKDLCVSLGLPVMHQNRIFNTACLVVDQQIIGFTAKRFLAGNGVYYEPRWFTPWPEGQVSTISFQDGNSYPIGDLHFNVGGVKVGFEICEDAWVPNRPGRSLGKMGIDLLLNPSASHFAFDKLQVRKRFVLEGSRSFGVAYIYANLLGNDSGRVIFDGGCLIASSGRLLAEGPRLSFDDCLLTDAVIDVDETRLMQTQISSPFEIAESGKHCLNVSFEFGKTAYERDINQRESAWENSKYLKEEEFTNALALGLFDYMRKSYSRGFVISLSGGADSSAVASCCYLMIKLGVEHLGLEKFKQKLSYIQEIQACQGIDEIAQLLITTAYQPTENSGEVTLNAAKTLAQAIHARFYELNVNDIFQSYRNIISQSIQRELNWEQDDLTLQNIQARVRAPSVWMLANIQGALLLSTSNRSEAAVGYATMDGDTSGGLSPIAGIDKAFLRQWLRWLETEGVGGQIRLPELHYVNEQQPTAELRPKGTKQTDESDLMPYDLLDAIEEAAIRDKKTPIECYLTVKNEFDRYSTTQLKTWVIKFFRLWCRNQWKRERYAPSFHLDDKNLDPKTWCRFPILSGGFDRELKELETFTS
ncbi:NAD(+) synthase [Rapidithrix thailandica]|uniref:Glutamine-dependent NAD(+) synthetase n=1 Tax=Rapidithrix thailandica TaxID=413964 RepID=A0AAW9S9M8_9BACT